jgi:hypothetical protein
MLASGLTITDQNPAKYFRTTFADDLKLVAEAADGAGHPIGLSVASFCPDFPSAPAFSAPARRFAELPDQRWFLSSLFATQLACQASHSQGGSYYYGPPAVLVGLLSSAHSVMHPAFLLLVLALYREPVQSADTGMGLNAILGAQLQDLRTASSLRTSTVFPTMRAALEDEQMPTSLRAFVPGGDAYKFAPDLHALRLWRAGLYDVIAAATS